MKNNTTIYWKVKTVLVLFVKSLMMFFTLTIAILRMKSEDSYAQGVIPLSGISKNQDTLFKKQKSFLSPLKNEESETTIDTDPHKEYEYPNSPSHFEIDEFIYCFFTNKQGEPEEDFGTITNFIPPDRYVIKLKTKKGWVSAPVESIRKAGTA